MFYTAKNTRKEEEIMEPDIKIFAENVEQGALDDIGALAAIPVNKGKKLRFMPDCHKGVTVPIGTSIPIDLSNPNEAIAPGTVGCDIGCTVSAVFYDKPMPKEQIPLFEHRIRKEIPFGFDINESSAYDRKELYRLISRDMARFVSAHPGMADFAIDIHCDRDMIEWFRRFGMTEKMFFNSLPSVGGGNHFVEYDENGELGKWAALVHCGSRNLGQKVFGYWEERASHDKVPKEVRKAIEEDVKGAISDRREIKAEIARRVQEWKDGNIDGYLSGDDLRRYLIDVLIAQSYARFNHELIHRRISSIYKALCGGRETDAVVSVHNYIDYDLEALDGTPHMMIRKGAIRSYAGEKMLIPFNMRDGVAVCEGKSNADWNFTAPHGAGRAMSRTQAFKTLSVDAFKAEMGDAGIYTTTANRDTLDEAPEAYKNKDDIVRLIEPTAGILFFLVPKMNIKAAEGKPMWSK